MYRYPNYSCLCHRLISTLVLVVLLYYYLDTTRLPYLPVGSSPCMLATYLTLGLASFTPAVCEISSPHRSSPFELFPMLNMRDTCRHRSEKFRMCWTWGNPIPTTVTYALVTPTSPLAPVFNTAISSNYICIGLFKHLVHA
jgi:hypothetical protein